MDKITITFADGTTLETEERYLNGHTLKAVRSGNPIILVSKRVG